MKLSSHLIINAPAEAVWDVIARQFDRIGEWATAIPAAAAIQEPPTATGAPVAGRVCDTGIRMLPHATETISLTTRPAAPLPTRPAGCQRS